MISLKQSSRSPVDFGSLPAPRLQRLWPAALFNQISAAAV